MHMHSEFTGSLVNNATNTWRFFNQLHPTIAGPCDARVTKLHIFIIPKKWKLFKSNGGIIKLNNSTTFEKDRENKTVLRVFSSGKHKRIQNAHYIISMAPRGPIEGMLTFLNKIFIYPKLHANAIEFIRVNSLIMSTNMGEFTRRWVPSLCEL